MYSFMYALCIPYVFLHVLCSYLLSGFSNIFKNFHYASLPGDTDMIYNCWLLSYCTLYMTDKWYTFYLRHCYRPYPNNRI